MVIHLFTMFCSQKTWVCSKTEFPTRRWSGHNIYDPIRVTIFYLDRFICAPGLQALKQMDEMTRSLLGRVDSGEEEKFPWYVQERPGHTENEDEDEKASVPTREERFEAPKGEPRIPNGTRGFVWWPRPCGR